MVFFISIHMYTFKIKLWTVKNSSSLLLTFSTYVNDHKILSFLLHFSFLFDYLYFIFILASNWRINFSLHRIIILALYLFFHWTTIFISTKNSFDRFCLVLSILLTFTTYFISIYIESNPSIRFQGVQQNNLDYLSNPNQNNNNNY